MKPSRSILLFKVQMIGSFCKTVRGSLDEAKRADVHMGRKTPALHELV